MPSHISDYQGRPVLILLRFPGDKFPWGMGMDRAVTALDNIEAIREFVVSQGGDGATRERWRVAQEKIRHTAATKTATKQKSTSEAVQPDPDYGKGKNL